MSDATIPNVATLIVAITGLVTAIGAIAAMIIGLRGVNSKQTVIHDDVLEIKKQTDGMTTALTTMTARANTAEGHAAGVEEERARPLDVPAQTTVKT